MALEKSASAMSPESRPPPRRSAARATMEGGRALARARARTEVPLEVSSRLRAVTRGSRGDARWMETSRSSRSSWRRDMRVLSMSSPGALGSRSRRSTWGDNLRSISAADRPAGSEAEAARSRPCPSQAPGASSEQAARSAAEAPREQPERIATRIESLPQACSKCWKVPVLASALLPENSCSIPGCMPDENSCQSLSVRGVHIGPQWLSEADACCHPSGVRGFLEARSCTSAATSSSSSRGVPERAHCPLSAFPRRPKSAPWHPPSHHMASGVAAHRFGGSAQLWSQDVA
mmetsp:Transcript_73260/g.238302  ORF Transcript_73260/g.238302 Transcript_73260/m.238302 type:complete len:291 (+) Transcript_73260:1001-1873(+)